MGMGLQEIRNERRSGLSIPEQINLFLEDQHPLVRSNIKLGAALLGFALLTHVGLWVALRVTNFQTVFSLELLLRLFETLLVLLFIMMTYNALRVLINYVRGQGVFTGMAVVLSFVAVVLVVLSFVMLPNIFKRSVAYSAGRSYGAVYRDFSQVCESWKGEWGSSDSENTLKIEEQDMGRLEEEAEVYKVQSTVFFNFGDENQEFGFACALRAREPSDVSRANNYKFDFIRGIEYAFEETKKP